MAVNTTERDQPVRSAQAEAWMHTKISETPGPCILCDQPAIMRHPQTGEPCHLICAQAEADAIGEPWCEATKEK